MLMLIDTLRLAVTFMGHTILGRTPLDEWSAQRKDLYLTTPNTHKRQTAMSPAGFETANLASQRLQTHSSDRVATEIGLLLSFHYLYNKNMDHMSLSGNPNICR